jgi:arsenate reductase-like glutaredoxin family protein
MIYSSKELKKNWLKGWLDKVQQMLRQLIKYRKHLSKASRQRLKVELF